MELLCVLAAVLALFLASAALTLQGRVPAGMAPLTVLSGIAAVFTLAGICPQRGRRAVGPLAAKRPSRPLAGTFHPRQRAVLGHDGGFCGLFFHPATHGQRLR